MHFPTRKIFRAALLASLLSLAFAAAAFGDNCEDCDGGGGGGGGGAVPATTINSGPAANAHTADITPTFTFSSSLAGSTFKCKVDGGVWANCDSPKTTSALAQGSHTFYVKAIKGLEEDPTPASRMFVVDSVSPTLSFTNSPAAGARTKDTTPTYHFTVGDANPTTMQCKVDNNAWAPCQAGSWTPAALSHGTHSVYGKATDVAGNVSSTVTRQIVIDTQAPVVSLVDAVATTTDNTPLFSFGAPHDGGGNYTFQCKIDSGAWTACNGGQNVGTYQSAELIDGQHTFSVKGADSVGNVSAETSHVFTVDTTVPAPPAGGEQGATGTTQPGTGSNAGTPGATVAGIQGAVQNAAAQRSESVPPRLVGKSTAKKRRTCKRVIKLKSGKKVKRAVKCKKAKKARRAKKRRN